MTTRRPSRIRLSSAVAICSLGLGACGGKVVHDSVALEGAACAAACEEQHPKGLYYYENVMVTCVCESCSESCSQSVCVDEETPSDECLPCVQDSLGGEACNHYSGLFGSGCLGHPECAAFVSCILACDGS